MNLDEDSELHLEKLESCVLPQLANIAGVIQIIGVGSYYLPTDKPPSDLDFLLVLDFSLTENDKTRCLGEAFETLQKDYSGERFKKDVRSVVSVFLKDADGNYLNGERLFNWYNDDFGFTVAELREETERTAEFRTGWEEAPILCSRGE